MDEWKIILFEIISVYEVMVSLMLQRTEKKMLKKFYSQKHPYIPMTIRTSEVWFSMDFCAKSPHRSPAPPSVTEPDQHSCLWRYFLDRCVGLVWSLTG